jgi:HK97 family phage portal protein
LGIFDIVGKAVANVGRGIQGMGYRLGSGAMITEMEVPPGMTYESYLRMYGQVGWLFGAVSLISESVAEVPWHLYRTDRGEREEIDEHPLLELMKHVNRFQTWNQFCQLLQMYIGLVGEAFIVLNMRGTTPMEMWLAPPQYMIIHPSATEYISHYEFRRGANRLDLEIPEVIHIMNPNPAEPYRGMGAAHSIGVDLDSERYATRYQNRLFYNDATPGLILEFPSLPPPPQREQLREEWNSIHQGWRNARKTGFLWGGAKANAITMTNRDMDFWRLRKINRETILGTFRIPTSLMGLAEVGSRARAEADEYIFAKRVVKPALTRIRESLNEQLCSLFDARLELGFEDPVPENVELIATQTREDFKAGMITREEARETRGYDRDAPKGDTFVMPMNLMPTPAKSTAPLQLTEGKGKALTEEQKEAHWRLYAAKTAGQERMFVRVLADLWDAELREIIKGIEVGKRDDFFEYDVEVDKFREAFEPVIHEVLSSAFEDAISELEPTRAIPGGVEKQQGIVDQAALEWIAARSLFMSKSLVGTTRDQVRRELAAGFAEGEGIPELTRRIRGYFDESLRHRAPMTARTETIAASNEGALKGYEAEKVDRVEFYAALDERTCPECNGLHEQIFAAADAHGKIPVHPNCRCTWTPVIGAREPTSPPAGIESLRYDEKIIKSEHDMAKWTAVHGKETSRTFGKDGVLLHKKNGGAHSISFRSDEIQDMRHCLLDVHTHPGNGSFSGNDFNMMAFINAKETHVITPKYRYIATRGEEGWDPRLLDRRTILSIDNEYRALRGEFYALLESGMSKDEAVILLSHRLNSKLAAKYKFKYEREEF